MKLRRRSLGNIRFIGELYRIKMLNGNIMHGCIRKLLKETDEESLECLCRLVTTIGAVSFVIIYIFTRIWSRYNIVQSTQYTCLFVTDLIQPVIQLTQ